MKKKYLTRKRINEIKKEMSCDVGNLVLEILRDFENRLRILEEKKK